MPLRKRLPYINNNTAVKRWYANVIRHYWGFCPLLPQQAHGVEFSNFIFRPHNTYLLHLIIALLCCFFMLLILEVIFKYRHNRGHSNPGQWKAKLPICLMNESPHYVDVSGSGGIAQPFSTSALDGDESSASCPGCFTLVERATNMDWTRGWVGPKSVWIL
jgi:hypothetical protein